ncbi:MAG TPA: hypothetical protein VE028_02325, partial [Nitratidesulfovibrio sp.]|nr:hypothetical protein [Nitratidesulfovibrio sp.]
ADGVPFLVGPLEHLLGTGQRHGFLLLRRTGVMPAGPAVEMSSSVASRRWVMRGGARDPGMPSEDPSVKARPVRRSQA